MKPKIITKTLKVSGMTCPGCEIKIEKNLKRLTGVVEAKAQYADELVEITFHSEKVSLKKIIEIIGSLGYKVESIGISNHKQSAVSEITKLLGGGIIIFALYLLIQNTIGFNFIPEVSQSMGYGILFTVGLLTSLHCIAMCGGINLSQCVSYKFSEDNKVSKFAPSLLYNAGRVVSYTLIGGIVGAIGSVISLSGTAKGAAAIIAGAFMLIMGLNMLNIFPGLRKLAVTMPRIFGSKLLNNAGKHGPFYVGLLNGFMPCGPLQTMQIYALGTGSFVAGALSMLMFSLGTVPLMFGFGAVSSMLSSIFSHKMMKVSAVLVVILGVIMLNRGLGLAGIDVFAYSSNTAPPSENTASAAVTSDAQYITGKLTAYSYPEITVQKGIPVKWTLQADAKDLNGCNRTLVIPEYNLEVKLEPGDNLIEFVPDETGVIVYSCWMGMIRSKINVVEASADFAPSVSSDEDAVLNPTVSSCCQ